jgi:uracil DNA glycosylase
MGLCFSVPKGIKMPSSLVNIFKEIQQDVGYPLPTHGNLERWAIQVCAHFLNSFQVFIVIHVLGWFSEVTSHERDL